jgi:hypothetical protein
MSLRNSSGIEMNLVQVFKNRSFEKKKNTELYENQNSFFCLDTSGSWTSRWLCIFFFLRNILTIGIIPEALRRLLTFR